MAMVMRAWESSTWAGFPHFQLCSCHRKDISANGAQGKVLDLPTLEYQNLFCYRQEPIAVWLHQLGQDGLCTCSYRRPILPRDSRQQNKQAIH